MKQTGLRDGVVTLAGIALLLALLRESSAIVVPFLLSLFIAIIAASPVDWLKRRGLSAAVSTAIVVLVIVVVLILIATMLGSTATQIEQALPGYQARVNELSNEVSTWLSAKGINVDKSGLLSAIDPAAVMGFTNTLVAGIGGALSNVFLIMFTVMFMLLEAGGFPRKLAAMGGDSGEAALRRLSEIVQGLNRYAAAKAFISIITGVLIWIGLELIGLDFAPLWGFIAFVLNFVPNIGSILAAVPAVLLAMLQLDPTGVLVVIAIYLGVNTIVGNVLEPTIMGQRVGLSVLTVFLSLVFWGWMFGPVGMLLSVPLSMVVKFATESNPQTRWLAVLLGPAPAANEGDEPAEQPKKKA
ncbi:AI-2E family transporter [Gammaproteobacteria bacterium]|nr:AI-2E family transporter [Gammaproteobacteria bacterium]